MTKIKITEIPSKIKIVKEIKKEESKLEEEVEKDDFESFSDFISSSGAAAPVLRSGQEQGRIAQGVFVEGEQEEEKNVQYQSTASGVYETGGEARKYEEARRNEGSSSVGISGGLGSGGPQSSGSAFRNPELDRLHSGEDNKSNYESGSIEGKDVRVKRRLPFEV